MEAKNLGSQSNLVKKVLKSSLQKSRKMRRVKSSPKMRLKRDFSYSILRCQSKLKDNYQPL